MSESRLFTDLFCLIAEELCEEPHNPNATTTLLNLCLTSRDMYRITTPLLYREIRLVGNPLGALSCFRTLLQNDLAAASVRTLRVHNLFDKNYAKHGCVLGPSTLIPVFSGTLRRLNNLSRLYLHPIPVSGMFQAELKELFEFQYPFSLRVLRIDLQSASAMSLINGQSDLCDLGFVRLPALETLSFHLPKLETVKLYLNWTNNEAISTVLQKHPQIKHATLRIFPGISPHALHTIMIRFLSEASNLTSLHLILKGTEDLPIALSLTGDSIWSESLSLLEISVLEGKVDSLFILSCINPVLRGKFPNLTATWFNCAPPPAMNALIRPSKVEGPTWDFYFEFDGQVQLARREKDRDAWTAIEQIERDEMLAVRARLSQIQ